MKKAKFHNETAAMAGHEGARYNLGCMENNSGNKEWAIMHVMIAAAAGYYCAMNRLNTLFEEGSGVIPLYGSVSKDTMESTLEAYNNSCAKMRSKARDAYINMCIELIEEDEEKSNG
jgi:hypothetical protein